MIYENKIKLLFKAGFSVISRNTYYVNIQNFTIDIQKRKGIDNHEDLIWLKKANSEVLSLFWFN